MKHFKTYESFKKTYGQKITPKEFKKIKKGSKILYLGGSYKVISNDGYAMKLEDPDNKKVIGINLGQFNSGGMIKEDVNSLISDPEIQKAWSIVYNTSFAKEHPNLFKILNKRPPVDQRELNRIWMETFDKSLEQDHPKVFDLLFNKS